MTAAISTAPIDEVVDLLRQLHPPHMRRHASRVLATAEAQRWDPAEAVRALLAENSLADGRHRSTSVAPQPGSRPARLFDTWDESVSSIDVDPGPDTAFVDVVRVDRPARESRSFNRFASDDFMPPYWASQRCHVDSATSRWRHASSRVLAGGQLLVAFGELADDLIRRVPPALLGCHGAVTLPALTGNTVAQHLDHHEGPSSEPLTAYGQILLALDIPAQKPPHPIPLHTAESGCFVTDANPSYVHQSSRNVIKRACAA